MRYIVVQHYYYDSSEPLIEKMGGWTHATGTDDDPAVSYATREEAEAVAERFNGEDHWNTHAYVWAVKV